MCALDLNGAGHSVLSGANTYSGGTTVNNGTLVVANTSGSATGTGNVTMNSGIFASAPAAAGRSRATCSPARLLTIAPGGVGTIGTLKVGGLTTASNLATLAFDLTTPGGDNDLLVIGAGGLRRPEYGHQPSASPPSTPGDYKLIEGTIVSGTLSNFSLPSAPSGKLLCIIDDRRPGLHRPGGNATSATANATLTNAQSGTFGPAVTATVAAGTGYKGLASYVNGVSNGNMSLTLSTAATIGGGTNNNAATVSFAWRTRTPNETSDLTATSPPMGHSGNPGGIANYLASDVLQLTGMNVTSGTADAYGLSMTYNPGLVGTGPPTWPR